MARKSIFFAISEAPPNLSRRQKLVQAERNGKKKHFFAISEAPPNLSRRQKFAFAEEWCMSNYPPLVD